MYVSGHKQCISNIRKGINTALRPNFPSRASPTQSLPSVSREPRHQYHVSPSYNKTTAAKPAIPANPAAPRRTAAPGDDDDGAADPVVEPLSSAVGLPVVPAEPAVGVVCDKGHQHMFRTQLPQITYRGHDGRAETVRSRYGYPGHSRSI